jgi:hypothetical protein
MGHVRGRLRRLDHRWAPLSGRPVIVSWDNLSTYLSTNLGAGTHRASVLADDHPATRLYPRPLGRRRLVSDEECGLGNPAVGTITQLTAAMRNQLDRIQLGRSHTTAFHDQTGLTLKPQTALTTETRPFKLCSSIHCVRSAFSHVQEDRAAIIRRQKTSVHRKPL